MQHIQRLRLTHFRNYSDLSLGFNPHINCITGKNGAGKTNILDAIHYLALARGIRSAQDRYALKEGEDFFFIEGLWNDEGFKQLVQCNYTKSKGKKLLLNRQAIPKLSEHIGKLPLVSILPSDTELINGPSALRRRFMDMLISQYNATYLQSLITYNKAIGQRNALLKQFAEIRSVDIEQLELWNYQLIPAGMYIRKTREAFVKEYAPIFAQYFQKIIPQTEVPTLQYKSLVKENTQSAWEDLLKQYEARDCANLYTYPGIHRDDLGFMINENSVRNYGSQGQQKTFLISLKLAQYHLLAQQKQKAPILLLDDIFDKLDEYRLAHIAKMIDEEVKGQVFITDTSHQRLQNIFQTTHTSKIQFFHVDAGVCKPLK